MEIEIAFPERQLYIVGPTHSSTVWNYIYLPFKTFYILLVKTFTSNNRDHKLTLEMCAASWLTYYSKYFIRQHFNFPLFFHHRLFSQAYCIIHIHIYISTHRHAYNYIFTILNSFWWYSRRRKLKRTLDFY